jgi:hypothetical protein
VGVAEVPHAASARLVNTSRNNNERRLLVISVSPFVFSTLLMISGGF